MFFVNSVVILFEMENRSWMYIDMNCVSRKTTENFKNNIKEQIFGGIKSIWFKPHGL